MESAFLICILIEEHAFCREFLTSEVSSTSYNHYHHHYEKFETKKKNRHDEDLFLCALFVIHARCYNTRQRIAVSMANMVEPKFFESCLMKQMSSTKLSYPNIRKSIHLYTSSDTYSKHRVARNLSENQVIIIPISPTNSIAMS